MTALDVEEAARIIVAARANKQPLRALTDTKSITMDQAYLIQAAVTQHRIAAGQQIVGWKLGYTSPAMREQMRIDQMNFAPLTDAMTVPNHSALPDRAVQPLVEPEIALVLAHAIKTPCGVDDVLVTVAEARACLEVVDPIWADRRFLIQDNTADGSSAAFFVLGDRLSAENLSEVRVTLRHDEEPIATATGAAADGHPAKTVAWLAAQLAKRRQRLRAGDIILTGGLTRAIPLERGNIVSAEFSDGSNAVTVSVTR